MLGLKLNRVSERGHRHQIIALLLLKDSEKYGVNTRNENIPDQNCNLYPEQAAPNFDDKCKCINLTENYDTDFFVINV